jgi:hypothetical protein
MLRAGRFVWLKGGLIAAVSLVLFTAHADARSWSFTGPPGGTWGRSVTRYNNGGGNFGRVATTTRPDGQTATRAFSRSTNNGTITDSRAFTGFNGASTHKSFTRTPGQGGTATYANRAGPW